MLHLLPVEIESKFRVPTLAGFDRLLSLERIGAYALKEPATKTVADHYLDTADGLIRRGGFALRLRQDTSKETWVASLKELGTADGAVHTRAEYEIPIEPDTPPDQWPESNARTLALQLSRGETLEQLIVIEQTRHTRKVVRGNQPVGELSLDAVTVRVGSQRHDGLEAEIELGDGGTLDDLAALNAALLELGLVPEPRSKFERALELLGA